MYRIRDWNKHFENSRTKDIAALNWVPIPNRMDGAGFTELADHKDGAAHYGVWVGLVLVASRCHPRGDLIKSTGLPHDCKSLSRITGFRSTTIEEAIVRLIQVKWIEEVATIATLDGNQLPCDGNVLPLSRMEGNRKEEKEREEDRGNELPRKFRPPTFEEVRAYCRERDRGVEPQKWFDHYTSNGWKVGRNPMKDWRAAVRKWEQSEYDRKPPDPNAEMRRRLGVTDA